MVSVLIGQFARNDGALTWWVTPSFSMVGFLGSTLSLLIHVEKMGWIPILNPLSFIQDTKGAIMPDTKITNQLKPSTNKYMGLLCIYI